MPFEYLLIGCFSAVLQKQSASASSSILFVLGNPLLHKVRNSCPFRKGDGVSFSGRNVVFSRLLGSVVAMPNREA